MAMGLKTNFVIDNPFVYTGYTEMLTQFSNAFNEQSGGAIRLTAVSKRGDFDESSFFQNISGLVSRRDPAADNAITDKNVDMATIHTVKLNRRVGPVAQSYDSFRKIGATVDIPENHKASGIDELDFIVGQQTGKAVQVEMVNTAMLSLVTALRGTAALTHNVALGQPGNTIDASRMVLGLAKMGDAAANKIKLWVMHSKAYYNLVTQQIASNVDSVTGFTLSSATPITLNRPVLVIDSPSLVIPDGVSAGVNSYVTLGLGGGAVEVEDTEDMMLATQLITGRENLGIRIQGEYAYNLGILGFDWDTVNGGINPSDAALGTVTNWDKKFADIKDLGGVVIETA